MAGSTVNLIDDVELTVALLADPLAWRVRVVEEISVDAATTCLRRRSLQVAPLRELLPVAPPRDVTHALIALFVAPMPRGPLLDFSVNGPYGEAWLLPRLEIASRQAMYLAELAESCGLTIETSLIEFISAICGFTGELLVNLNEVSLADYLEQGIGRPIAPESIRSWSEIGEECRATLRPHLDVFRGYSAPENPAIVLPELFAAGAVTSDSQATAQLRRYADLLIELDEQGSPAADAFLIALADYANSYDLMVAMKVPLDEPFLVKFEERRDMKLSAVANRGQQELVVADAQTNHVTFKVQDPNVRIRQFTATEPGSNEFSYGAFQSRADAQNRSLYAHDPDRDYRISLKFQLGLLRRLQLVPYLVSLLLAILAAGLLVAHPTDLRSLAIVVGPAALAASVLLAREPSTLGSRLRLASTMTVTASLVALVAIATALFAYGTWNHEAKEHKNPQRHTHSDVGVEK